MNGLFRSALPAIVLSFAIGATAAVTVAHAQTALPAPAGGPPATPPPTAAVRPQDPVLHDPVLLRNCQAEYDQAIKGLSLSSGSPDWKPSAADLARADAQRHDALLKKLDCKTDQINRKLDYVLNVNVPRR